MNTKPNRDITAEILKEFEGRLDMAIYDNESVAHNREHYLGFMSDALTKQKEEIDADHIADVGKMIEGLRMSKMTMSKDGMSREDILLSGYYERGHNTAVDEFNQKLDNLLK